MSLEQASPRYHLDFQIRHSRSAALACGKEPGIDENRVAMLGSELEEVARMILELDSPYATALSTLVVVIDRLWKDSERDGGNRKTASVAGLAHIVIAVADALARAEWQHLPRFGQFLADHRGCADSIEVNVYHS